MAQATTQDNSGIGSEQVTSPLAQMLLQPAVLAMAARRAVAALTAAAETLDAEAAKPAEIRTPLLAAAVAAIRAHLHATPGGTPAGLAPTPLATCADRAPTPVATCADLAPASLGKRSAVDDDKLAGVRDLLQDAGVLWGRDAIRRYGVRRFSDLTPAQISSIRAELVAAFAEIDARGAAD